LQSDTRPYNPAAGRAASAWERLSDMASRFGLTETDTTWLKERAIDCVRAMRSDGGYRIRETFSLQLDGDPPGRTLRRRFQANEELCNCRSRGELYYGCVFHIFIKDANWFLRELRDEWFELGHVSAVPYLDIDDH
jgi:hypothetical protein